MKALVLTAYNRFEVQDVPQPAPAPHELLVEVKACGICGSDVHGMDGSTGRRIPPIIMGHEAAGVVAGCGSEVTRFTPGQRVTFDSMISCGRCGFCRSGQSNLCDARRVLGVSCAEFRQDGAFAEFVVVPEHIAVPLPNEVSFEQAAMIEPVSVAVHAVGRLPLRLGDSAAVIGTGMIGLLVVQALRAAGCGRLVAVDVSAERLELARELGADEGVLATGGDSAEEIMQRTGGRGVDLAVEAVGVTATVSAAVRSVRKGGSVALVGNLAPQVDLPLQSAVTRELTLFGSCASAGEYPQCLELLARGAIRVDPMISALAPLDEGQHWFERLHRGDAGLMKVLLQP